LRPALGSGMSKLSIAPTVMASITFFVGVYWLFIYFRRRASREDLTFALTCLALGIYDIYCAGLYSAADVAHGVIWQRGQLTSAALIAIAFTFFVSDYTKRVPRSWVIGMVSFFSVAAVATILDRSDLTWIASSPLIKRVHLPFGIDLTYYEANPGPLIRIQFAASVLSFAYFFLAAFRQYRHGNKRRAKMLIVAMAIFFMSVTNDVLVGLGLYSFIYTTEYGYLAMVLLMSYSLSNELVEAIVIKEERRGLEEKLRQAQKMEAIGRLAGGIAHDLNNQLTPIIGYSDIALNRQRSVDDLKGFIEQMRQSAEHAKDLASQLLAFGRKQVLDMAVININDVVSEFKQMLRRLIREDIEIRFSLDPDLGNIQADPTQVRQVLMNLVLNARDAMPKGGIMSIETENATIDKAYQAMSQDFVPGRYVMIGVSDTGCGMDKAVIEHVFEPFFTTKQDEKGSGWGLATVYGIVKQHRGNIFVYSEIGQGSIFKVYFPRADTAAPSSVGLLEHPVEVGGEETILVVEDEEAVRKMVHEVLEDLGYLILEAGNPEEAIRLSGEYEGEIDLLLTDVIMPGMNGKELFERMAISRSEMKVLFMSGYAGDAIADRGILDQGVCLVTKPFSIQKLTQMVRAALDQAE
jgi:signal transduction histidine kinase/CheY-like chemotaxis protein